MDVTHGMTLAEGRALAHRLQTSASGIEEVLHQLQMQLDHTAWRGNDRDNFESNLRGPQANGMRAAGRALREGAEAVLRHAEAQERASGR